MELQQLKYFQTVARLEHMSRAAVELYISQPSLSMTIARLEEDIGVPLFDRNGRHIRLNKFGKAFLRRVEIAFSQLEDGRREVTDLAGFEHGIISLASLNLSLLADLLNSFRSKYPHMKFRFFQDTGPAMQQQLENGTVDLCISSPPILGSGINSVPLLTEEIVLVVPAGHRLAEQGHLRLIDAANESFINLKTGYPIRDRTDELCRQAGFIQNVTFEVNQPGLIWNLVTSGYGIALMPITAWKMLKNPSAAVLHITEPSCQRIIGLSWFEGRYISVAASHFRQFVIDYFMQFHK